MLWLWCRIGLPNLLLCLPVDVVGVAAEAVAVIIAPKRKSQTPHPTRHNSNMATSVTIWLGFGVGLSKLHMPPSITKAEASLLRLRSRF